jgi:hypothetical protein
VIMLLQTLHARTQTPVEMDPDVMPREILVKFQHSSTTEEREQQRIIYGSSPKSVITPEAALRTHARWR